MILDDIAKSSGMERAYLAKIARSANFRYKTYTIPKRTGGTRTIDHPSKELKFLQTWLVGNLFHHLPVHDSVYSYREGVGVRQHANKHRRQNYLLRVDFANFFPSISAEDIKRLLRKNQTNLPIYLSDKDYEVITSIACKDGHLTIGAPSSPILSNAVMYEFDVRWSSYCHSLGVVYSRYADDLYLSTNRPNVLTSILAGLHKSLSKQRWPQLRINEKKTTFTSRKRRRIVTGLVLSSENKISLGRGKKRMIKSLVYRFVQQKLDSKGLSYLCGYISYAHAIEPLFVRSLERKYGTEVMNQIRRAPTISRKGMGG